MKNTRVYALLLMLLLVLISPLSEARQATSMIPSPSCGIIGSYLPSLLGTYFIRPFPAYTADYRSDYPGTYYVAHNVLLHYLNAANIGWDGILGTRDDGPMNLRLANVLSLSELSAPVASDRRILYDIVDSFSYGDPLILYDIGADHVFASSDDRIIPLLPHHVVGPDTKDIAREALIYMIARNGPPIIVYHHLGQDGAPSADDYAAALTHYSFSVTPLEAKVSWSGKFALRFSDGRGELYDLGNDMRYSSGAGDDQIYSPSNVFIHEVDLSPDGRYFAYTYNPGNPTNYLDIYDVGPNGRFENMQGDDSLYTIIDAGNITEPRIDGLDPNTRATARLVYFNITSAGQQVEYLNAGNDGIFGSSDDFGNTLFRNQTARLLTSLRIAGSLVTFEDNANIYFDSLCA